MVTLSLVISILIGLGTNEDFEMELAKVFRARIEHVRGERNEAF
jgi:hypothetical protein